MTEIINAFSFASVLTALFCFRYSLWVRPRHLAIYFTFFFALEVVLEKFFLPPGAIPIAAAWICFFLTAVFIAVSFLSYKYEQSLKE
jgi:hypothetical protein